MMETDRLPAFIETRMPDVRHACQKHHVRRLDLFGSAATPQYEPGRSDLDFLVSFEDLNEGKYADAYFELLEELQEIFQSPVDLVTESSIRNPYFDREIQRTRRELYVA